jgi:hypothetical protein
MVCAPEVIVPVEVKLFEPIARVPPIVRDVRVPTDVSEEVTTVEFNVVPVNVPAGAMTTLPLAAVMRPLALTVNVGMEVEEPNVPTFPLTVARVVARAPADVVMSPVNAGNLPAANVPVALVPERSTAFTVMA